MSAPSRSKGKQSASSGEKFMMETEQLATPAPEIVGAPPRGRRLKRKDDATLDISTGTPGFVKCPLVPQLTPLWSSLRGRQSLTLSTLSPLSPIEEQRNSGAMNGK